MASIILHQLDTYGPQHCEQLSYEQAAAYTGRLARSHYENFSVVSFMVPRRLRDDFANIYAFCRWADDLGDETGDPEESLKLLTWWRSELDDCYAGLPRHPVYVALQHTIEKHDIPIKPFADLIDAFIQDQRVTRYESWEQVLDYCARSADPVGRLVLYLCGYRDERRQILSDKTCTALQLVNFWQDVRRDIVERDRIYVPAEALDRHGLKHDDLVRYVKSSSGSPELDMAAYCHVIRDLVDRTVPLFEQGKALLPLLDREVRLPIQLFTLGGEAVVSGIKRVKYETLDHRPRIGKGKKMTLMARALSGRLAAMLRPGGGESS